MTQEEINNLKKRLFSSEHSEAERLVMERVPKPTVKFFKEIANKEYCGDYGLCFKAILDRYLEAYGMIGEIRAILEDHEMRIISLEGKPKRETIKRMMDGSIFVKENGKIRKIKPEEKSEEEKNEPST